MQFSQLVFYFERLEITSKRLELFSILADLFNEVNSSEMDKVIYLLQGELLPPFHGINIGMAEKYLLRAIAKSADIEGDLLLKEYRNIGDIGKTAEAFCRGNAPAVIGQACRALTVSEVYQSIDQLAVMGG